MRYILLIMLCFGGLLFGSPGQFFVCDGVIATPCVVMIDANDMITVIDPNCITDESIKLLCSSGRVCAVRGHIWEETPVVDYYPQWFYSIDTLCSTPTGINDGCSSYSGPTRTCKLCGLMQTKVEVWK